MWKEQLCGGYDWALVRGAPGPSKMARVTPRLGNGPRFGTCSVLFQTLRQIFSLQLPFLWFLAYVRLLTTTNGLKKERKLTKWVLAELC